MAKKVTYLTQEGYDQLVEELNHLIDVDRPKNIEALKEARAQGDLSENADYDAARDEQARIAARINEIQDTLKNYEIIKESDDLSKVTLTKYVTLEFVDLGETKRYQIVGTTEAKPFEGKISNESPIGAAIMNKKINTTVKFINGAGKETTVKIIKIENKK